MLFMLTTMHWGVFEAAAPTTTTTNCENYINKWKHAWAQHGARRQCESHSNNGKCWPCRLYCGMLLIRFAPGWWCDMKRDSKRQKERGDWPAGRLFFIKLLCGWLGDGTGVKWSREAVVAGMCCGRRSRQQKKGSGVHYSCGHIKTS